MTHITSTIDPKMTIDCLINRQNMLVSYPLNSYHPYERMGKHVIQDVYANCRYKIAYGKTKEHDRVVTFRHTPHRIWTNLWRRLT